MLYFLLDTSLRKATKCRNMWQGFVMFIYISVSNYIAVDDAGARAVSGVDLGPLAYCDWWFESRWGHGSLSLVCVVCC